MGSLACFGGWSWIVWILIILLFIWLFYKAIYGNRYCRCGGQGGYGCQGGCRPYQCGPNNYGFDPNYY